MKDIGEISIQDFNYPLPDERIASHPLPQRDQSKLLIYNRGQITEDIFWHLPAQLPPGTLLVFNNTRVMEARLLFKKDTGGLIEIFCLEPGDDYPDIATAMLQKTRVKWKCLVGGASKWKPGQVLEKKIGTGSTLKASYIAKLSDSFLIDLSWTPIELSFAEILHQAGAIPLPPYIKRKAEPSDSERYQTVYANEEGSVAAPTAGLHFTQDILDELEKNNISRDFVTLHVGAGTFRPVKTERAFDHEMHAEWIQVEKKTIEHILSLAGKKIIAVGTTSLRTLESLYWIGVRIINEGEPRLSEGIQQWEPYQQYDQSITLSDSLGAIINWMNKNGRNQLSTQTRIMIVPGYEWKVVDGLITNFHLPQSTLLLLVAAFIGNDWRNIYDYALQNDYRFLSYGDGSLLWR